jgi:hypothetical protein
MRHPDDPDIVLDSKAAAALCLAVLGFATGVLVGGAIPATIALVMARQASAELQSGEGWRSGARFVLWARGLAWAAIGLAAIGVMLLLAVHVLQDVGITGRDYPENVN